MKLPILKRKHIPTNNVSTCQWTAAQHEVLAHPDWYPERTVLRVCDELVAKWNRQQPKEWFYWIDKE